MEMAVTAVVGIDVSKHKLDVVLRTNGKAKAKALKNHAEGFEELIGWLRKQAVELR